ncbi:MAG: septum formation protein Maf [Planctomycetota bacterium]|nr:MAG: septum formation protein Maf [Planctomycetota bacterium]
MAEELSVSIILASASPRRQQLLAEAGYKFAVVTADIDESAFTVEHIGPCAYARRVALAKAKSVAGDFPDCLVIAADTVVDFDGEIIGKPADAEDAERITRKLFSKPHKVITAVAFVRLTDGVELVESDTTTVYPKKMSEERLAEHIKSGSWQGKAGAYAIQEGGDEFIEKIDGSLTNVMGLPMELLEQMLGKVIARSEKYKGIG